MKKHLDKVEDFSGFALGNANKGETVNVLTKALLTSDSPQFYPYIEQISDIFLAKNLIPTDYVSHLLILIHQDLSADLFINDFATSIEIKTKKPIDAGEAVMDSDISDISKIRFPGIEIKDTDKVVYCFKVGWRFGLYFDLTPRSQPPKATHKIATEKLNVDKMESSIGDLYRYLTFYHVYKVLESDTQFDEMLKDGWFPFVEIIAKEYKELSAAYQDRFNFDDRVSTIVDSFNEDRINQITKKWWNKPTFADKKSIIEAGINAYLQDDKSGHINCIKNLWTEIEGILRRLYHIDTGKGDRVKTPDLISHIINKAKAKSSSEHSLFLPTPFLKYLEDVVFANFDVKNGKVNMSRNSSSHGVVEADLYTKARALQLILILDQIYFYS